MYNLFAYLLLPLVCVSLVYSDAASSTSFSAPCDPDDLSCLMAKDKRDLTLVRVRPEQSTFLPCHAFSTDASKVEWWFGRRARLVGTWTKEDRSTSVGRYAIGRNATLLVSDVNRDLVEEYECLVFNETDTNATTSSFVLLRLDFSFFYHGPVFSTVFWGSCLTSLIVCVSTLILNVLWIVIRKVSIWWINRSERLNRVRNMLEAIEKYRSKQLESLHENYQRRINAIRENYHQQVEEIRSTYARQTGRFHDYRQAKMDSVTQHLDNIRDNYNQQLNRIREYGARRAEQLAEGYERQLNRVRTFTLQHRLKLMRQYKVKQNQINKLLENIAATNDQKTIQENEQAIREILDLKNGDLSKAGFDRPASFYSLPDLTGDDFTFERAGRLPLVNFQKFRRATDQEEPVASTSSARPNVDFNEPPTIRKQSRGTTTKSRASDGTPELEPTPNSPLLGHRRRPSNLRSVASFNELSN